MVRSPSSSSKSPTASRSGWRCSICWPVRCVPAARLQGKAEWNMKTLLKGGRILDPVNAVDGTFDLLIDGDRIAQVGRDLPVGDATVIEISAGLVICPGFIDMHVHLREPGQEHKETVATGTAA